MTRSLAAVRPPVVLIMGVSGSGKSTTGRNLGRVLDWEYRDADTFHPPANIEKMRHGIALEDMDRWPWLDAIGTWMDSLGSRSVPGIVSCSALKRAYRDRLRGSRPQVALVYLKGTYELIDERLSRRKGHFMPRALLESQFAALEEPAPAEKAVVVPIHLSPRKVIERIVTVLELRPLQRTR